MGTATNKRTITDRVDDVFAVLEKWTTYEPSFSINNNIPHTLTCGTRIVLKRININAASSLHVHVVIVFDVALATSRCETLHDAAAFIVNTLDRGKLCLECGIIHFHNDDDHMCETKATALIVGMKPEQCCACLEECCGLYRMECSHIVHAVCAKRIENGKCPVCRRSIRMNL